MLDPAYIDNPGIFFQRYDPLREAQELLQELRLSASPVRPRGGDLLSQGETGSGFSRVPPSPRVPATPLVPPLAAAPGAAATPVPGTPLPLSARRRPSGGSVKAAADLKFRHLPKPDKEPDFSRQPVLKKEQLSYERRWPQQATWAGQEPDKLPARFHHVPTFRCERGDGRNLPHERGKVLVGPLSARRP
ncbi:unnamed protein product [Effrenium voratum]|uniref:Uncharacterized protein n=1 Tax=Effrenium voratum TaxID=2562239 RepID=A0AA36I3E8_9DINO|nr:unnamed protein product [Effrenium voratum]CAJ1448093.1 unnamed protein product [Effrenium voratum]